MNTNSIPEGWKGSDLRSRAEVVDYLRAHGGTIEDQTGLVVGTMRTELGKGRALSQLLSDMDDDGMITREVRGRRTFRITLVNDWGLTPEARFVSAVVAREEAQPAIDPLERDVAKMVRRIVNERTAALRRELTEVKAELAELRAANIDKITSMLVGSGR